MTYTATGVVYDPVSGNAVSSRPTVVAYRQDTGASVETQTAAVSGLVTFTALPDGVQCGARVALPGRRHVEVVLTTPIGSFPSATYGATATAATATNSAGAAATVSRSDHAHGVTWATTSDIADVGGTEATGSATTVARGDHKHALEFAGTVGAIAATTANGASTYAARADHAHAVPPGHITNAMVNASADISPTKLEPRQFKAYASADIPDVSGDGTDYDVVFNTAETGSANLSGGVFTAPEAGWYFVQTTLEIRDVGAGHTNALIFFVVTGGAAVTIRGAQMNPAAIAVSGFVTINASDMLFMAAGDTVKVRLRVSGSTKTVDIYGTAERTSRFTGWLVG
jgi:hypothetical protein